MAFERLKNALQRHLTAHWVPPPGADGGGLDHWRGWILFGLLASGLALSPLAWVPVTALILDRQLWYLAAVNAVATAVWAWLLFDRRMELRRRSCGALLVLYAIGLGVLTNVGIFSGGPFWLFSISVVAALLLGFRATAATVLVNGSILAGVGFLIGRGIIGDGLPYFETSRVALSTLGNYVLLNAGATVAVSIMVRGLERMIRMQQETSGRLREEIEERIRAEAALRENEMKYRQIFDNIQDVYYEAALDGRILEISPSVERISQYRREELIGRSLYEIYADPDQRDRFVRLIVANRRAEDYEITLTDKDGSRRDCSLFSTLVSDDQGRPAKIVGSLRDITERKLAQETLRRSEERYRFLIENSNDIIWTFDLEKMAFDYCSNSVERLLGHSPGAVRGMTLDDVFRPETARRVRKAFATLLSGKDAGAKLMLEAEHRTREGGWVWMEINATLSRDDTGRAVSLMGVTRDIRERKRAEAERDRLADRELQLQKSESLGRMAGAVAHLFNNQLAVVMGNLELALEDAFNPGLQEHLGEAMAAAHASAEISRRMLTYLGLDPGTLEPLDLAAVCRAHLPALGTALPARVTLQADLAVPGPRVLANANQVQQVLSNLVANGVEALGDAPGTITLAVRTLLADEVAAVHVAPNDWRPSATVYACLEVSDTGPGIREKDRAQLFDPFFTTRMIGRGLGLPVVLGIVKSWGGAVAVESIEGEGATFRVLIPLLHPASGGSVPAEK